MKKGMALALVTLGVVSSAFGSGPIVVSSSGEIVAETLYGNKVVSTVDFGRSAADYTDDLVLDHPSPTRTDRVIWKIRHGGINPIRADVRPLVEYSRRTWKIATIVY